MNASTILSYTCLHCKNQNQSLFVIDHTHGSLICTNCGCEIPNFMLIKTSHQDYSRYNCCYISKNREEDKDCSLLLLNKHCIKKSKKSYSFQKNKNHLELIHYLCECFQTVAKIEERAIWLYQENYSEFMLKRKMRRADVLAAACFGIACESSQMQLSYKEIARFLLENQIKSKHIAKYVQLVKRTLVFQKKSIYKTTLNASRTSDSVTRFASILGIDFEQENLARTLVEYIEEQEVMRSLNPMSILSVAFFTTIFVFQSHSRSQTVIKKILKQLSRILLIAPNTIRKAVREARLEITRFIFEKSIIFHIDETRLKEYHLV